MADRHPGELDARRAARGTAFALAAAVIEKGGAMAIVVLLARLLGTEDFGRYAAVMSLLALVQVAVELGQEPVLVRLLAQERTTPPETLVAGALALRLALALAGGGLVAWAGALVLPSLGRVPLALAGVGLVAGSGVALRAFFRTLQRLEWLCVTALAGLVAFAAGLLVASLLGIGLAGAVAAWAGGQLATSVAAVILAGRRLSPVPRWHGAVAARLARSGWPLALNTFLVTVTLRVGQLIVLRSEGATAVGYLAAGARLAEGFALLPEALMLVLLPVLAAAAHDEGATRRRVSVQAARYLGLLALAVVVATSIAAPVLLALLFGAPYAVAAPALQVLAWIALFAATGTVITNLLIARGLERVLLAVNAFTSLVTVVLSLVLVPRVGFVGAAVATVVASVAAQGALLAWPETRADVAACLRPLLVPVVAGVLLAVAGMTIGGPPLVLATGAVSIFALVVLATGSVGRGDWAFLRRALGA